MTKKCLHLIAAARPNFMKIAPLYHALGRAGAWRTLIVHSGQHYDRCMSELFFEDLELPLPDYNLGVGSGSHAQQTGQTMIAYEKLLEQSRPDLTIVVGDVNATAACALVCAKSGVPLAHLEAGLRSFDRSMPEEINRVVTDRLADWLWTPAADADENLKREGIPAAKIKLVGNIMIDSLELLRPKIEKELLPEQLANLGQSFGLLTLHRPSNVDEPRRLGELVEALGEVARRLLLIFPVHPRTKKRLVEFGLWDRLEKSPGIILEEPLGYRAFMKLLFSSSVVISDSGGLQEESTYLGVPCLTLRPNTERPITLTLGTNRLSSAEHLAEDLDLALKCPWPSLESRPEGNNRPPPPPLWDGKCAERIVAELQEIWS